MSKTYAIADLHGRFDLLEAAGERISIYSGMEPGTIVFMGDYVDRGPQSAQIIKLLKDKPVAGGWKLVCLKGNHEDMMVETLRVPLHPDWWIGNGGGATLVSYGHPQSGVYDATVVPKEHIDWIDALPTMHVDKHRVYVHAGVDSKEPLNKQSERNLLWMLYADDDDIGHGDKHVVHGHHQFEDGPILLQNRTDLDTLAWLTGRLVVGVFDDDIPGGPVDLIEVQLARDPRFPAEQLESA